MPELHVSAAYQPTGDQPRAIGELAEAIDRGDQFTTLLGATGTGKTHTMAGVIERGAEADPGGRPQQDAGRPAVQRVPRVLPAQRGRVLRLLLRLLPARGLPAGVGHLHREGLLDQRRHRPPAARRHRGAVRPPRRRDRGLGVVHLRHRLAGELLRAWCCSCRSATSARARRSCASWSTSSTSATTWSWAAAGSGCGAT